MNPDAPLTSRTGGPVAAPSLMDSGYRLISTRSTHASSSDLMKEIRNAGTSQ